MAEIIRDRTFFEASGGGLTLAGGEPLNQAEFSLELLRSAKNAGIHTCVETSGYGSSVKLRRMVRYTDLFLYDLRETEPVLHRERTGAELDTALANLKRIHNAGSAIIVRLPIVAGLTNRSGHFEEVARLLGGMPQLRGVQVIPYNRLTEGRLVRLDSRFPCARDFECPREDEVGEWEKTLKGLGLNVIPREGEANG
jgi:pyruvate formate lyase activating enzyme